MVYLAEMLLRGIAKETRCAHSMRETSCWIVGVEQRWGGTEMVNPATTTMHRKDPRVLKALRDAAGRPMTPEERHKQRVSFIMGTMSRDSTITREEVRKIIKRRAV